MSDLGNKEIFSRNLKYYMNLYNKSRNDICKDLGFSYTTFTSWYNGDFYPRIDKIEILANYFNIEKSDLIEEHNNHTSDFDQQFKICGERLAKLRTNLNLTIQDLSQKTDISAILLERYEKGIVSKMRQSTISDLANFYDVNPVWLMGYDVPMQRELNTKTDKIGNPVSPIPILKIVKAGYNYFSQENVIGTIDVEKSLVGNGEDYFALKVKGDSMFPVLIEDDIVVIKKQNDFENGNIVVALINGDEATIKKGKKSDAGILLQPFNNSYEPLIFTFKEMETIPVTIVGIVKQLKREF